MYFLSLLDSFPCYLELDSTIIRTFFKVLESFSTGKKVQKFSKNISYNMKWDFFGENMSKEQESVNWEYVISWVLCELCIGTKRELGTKKRRRNKNHILHIYKIDKFNWKLAQKRIFTKKWKNGKANYFSFWIEIIYNIKELIRTIRLLL